MATKIVTAHGNAQISTTQYKLDAASVYLDGTGDYLSTPSDPDFNFGSADFTIDFWFRPDTASLDRHSLYCQYDASNNYIQFSLNGGTLYLFAEIDGSIVAWYSSAVPVYEGVWYHVALVRAGTSITFYIDGVAQTMTASTAISTNSLPNLTTGDVVIGAREYTGVEDRYAKGYFDEYRVSKGIARWTGNFTPPSSAYETDEYTALLLHMDGSNGSTAFTDDSVASGGGATFPNVNIGSAWKSVSAMSVNIGGAWKSVESVSVNIGGAWKDLSS